MCFFCLRSISSWICHPASLPSRQFLFAASKVVELRVAVQLCPWRQEDTEQREERNMQNEDIRSAIVLVRAALTAEIRNLDTRKPTSVNHKGLRYFSWHSYRKPQNTLVQAVVFAVGRQGAERDTKIFQLPHIRTVAEPRRRPRPLGCRVRA